MVQKIITGIKPTGASMHLGNLMGAVLPFARQAKNNDAALFIPDLHALTSVKDGETLMTQTQELAIEYVAILGMETPIHIFRQSDIHDITKLMWIISNTTPYSLMLRAHSFKDAKAKNKDINMGVFNYPILMAADILAYDIDAVPVGKDQLQHMEMTRDIARFFNTTYKTKIFKEPKAIITKNVEVLPGIDGQKMSKSYNNFIGVFDAPNILKKKVMAITTSSTPIDAIKDTKDCTIFHLVKVFGTPDELEFLRNKYETPNIGFGYGHAKTFLFDILNRELSPYRERREALLLNTALIETKLTQGALEMNRRLGELFVKLHMLVGV